MQVRTILRQVYILPRAPIDIQNQTQPAWVLAAFGKKPSIRNDPVACPVWIVPQSLAMAFTGGVFLQKFGISWGGQENRSRSRPEAVLGYS